MISLRRKVISLFLIFSLFVGIVGLANMDTTYAATKKIHLKKTTVSIVAGKTYQQKLINKNGKTISAAKVKWKSLKTSVAKINKNGKITAVKAGTAKMTAKYKGKTYKFTVKVSKTPAQKVYAYIKANGDICPEEYTDSISSPIDLCINRSETTVDSRGRSVIDTYYIGIDTENTKLLYLGLYRKYIGEDTRKYNWIEFNMDKVSGLAKYKEHWRLNGNLKFFEHDEQITYKKYNGKTNGITDTYTEFTNPTIEYSGYTVVGVDKLLYKKMKMRLRSIGFSKL